MRPIVAFLTDFGSEDYYVGAMKGAVLAACPETTLVDIAHELSAHAIAEGAFVLGAAYRAFPAGSVFLAVVDPGVGSERNGLALEAGGYRFVGPDNGIFSFVLDDHPDARAHLLSNAGLFRYEVSPTFHGRDVFAPVAAHLAAGLPIDQVGPQVHELVRLPLPPPRDLGPGECESVVAHVDRFGNVTTTLKRPRLTSLLEQAGADLGDVVVTAGDVVLPLVRTYADVSRGEACALIGSAERLEIAVNQGSAARELGLGRGDRVRVRAALLPDPGPG